jgi:hypothetical protein
VTAIEINAGKLDAWLDAKLGPRSSLCPGREHPTTFAELWPRLDLDAPHALAVFHATQRVVHAIVTHFPDNVFWDLDLVVQSLADRTSVAAIDTTAHRLVRLMQGFGMRSAIRFRYVHDFTYGFDWAKWVAKAPERRRQVAPFDDFFLAYLEHRCEELLALIASDDVKYGRLRNDQPRNPFTFSREPQDERRLHALLAERGLIPVATWDAQGDARWGAEFAERRAALAAELGITR